MTCCGQLRVRHDVQQGGLIGSCVQLYLKQKAAPLPDSLASSSSGSSNRVRAEDLEPPKQGQPQPGPQIRYRSDLGRSVQA